MRKVFWYSVSTGLFLVFAAGMFGGILALFQLYDFYAKDLMPARGLEQTWYTASWLIGCIVLRQVIMFTSKLADGKPSTTTTEKTHVYEQKKEKVARPYSKG